MRVFHFDDQGDPLVGGVLHFEAKDLGLEIQPTITSSVTESISILGTQDFDLIILDLIDQSDGDKITGIRILEFLASAGKRTSVFIYTGADKQKTRIKPASLLKDYSFIKGYFDKGIDYDDIKLGFRKFLAEKDLVPRIFELIDKHDYRLISEINSIGQNEINTLLVRIKKYFPKDESKYVLSKITSGLSGASIFRVEYELGGNKKSLLLKISPNKDAIKKEYSNTELYKLLPRAFRLEYDKTIPPSELETDKYFAIVIEYAEKTSTLYDWLLSDVVSDNPAQIDVLLSELFLENGLSSFYASNKLNSREKYNHIFKKLDETRVSFIKNSIIDLDPIIKERASHGFDLELIDQIIFHNTYKKISFQESKPMILQKDLILTHGDFHSRNILVSSTNRPTIIDTGGFGYDYWCSDLSRLIVHLFIEGFDAKTYDFFSIASQIERLETAKQIIAGDEISVENSPSMNNGFIHSINWLRKNAQIIHPDMFSEWEFQLNLGLEFFKASYKSIVLPPGKRVLALMSACEAIRQANDKVT